MRLKLSQIYVFSLYAALIGQACVLVGLPFKIHSVASLGTYLIVVASLLCLGAWFVDRQRNDYLNKLLLVGLIVFTGLSVLYSWVFSYAVFVKVMTFLELPIFLMTAEKINGKITKQAIYTINMLYPILFVILYISPLSHVYVTEYGVGEHENITLGYGNPNEVGMYLLFNFIVLFSALFKYENIYLKVLCIVETVFVGYLIILTDSRAAIIAAVLLVLASVLFKKDRLPLPVLLTVFAIPILFFFVLRWLPDFTILGEEFDTGRTRFYNMIFEQMNFEKFIFGDFTSFKLDNMHNALLSVFASLGVVSTVLFVVILFRQTKRLGRRIASKEKKVLLIGVLVIVIHSAVEAAVLVSGSAYATLLFMLYYLCLDDSKNEENSLNENIAY